MKTLLKNLRTKAFILFAIVGLTSFSQEGINYQGVARDVNSDLIVNTNIALDINIVETAPGGTIVYSETHNTMTDDNGVFSVVIGEGTSITPFIDINWAEDKHFLNVWLDGTEVGTTQFQSVPYTQAIGKWQAHKNGVAAKGTGGSIFIGENAGENEDLTDNNNIGIGENALQTTSTGFSNVAIGYEPLLTNRDGNWNIGIGERPLYSNITGSSNIALGNKSLFNNTSGGGNIGIGQQSLHSNTTGNHNIAFGHLSLYDNTGSYNIAGGYRALSKNSTGENNTAFGQDALYNNTTGSNNIALGYKGLSNNTTGYDNISIGQDALNSNTTGAFNIAMGKRSLGSNTEGGNNIALGQLALRNNTTGTNNIANGVTALYSNTEGDENIALGPFTLYNNTSGNGNIALGSRSLQDNTTGIYNVATGFQALYKNTIGAYNVAGGYRALSLNTTGNNNIAFGQDALYSNTTGYGNIALGFFALNKNTTSITNLAIGTGVLKDHITGNSNIGLGTYALNKNTTGEYNIAVGNSSLDSNLTGSRNTAIGYRAGGDTMGSGNVFIGAFSGTHSNFENTNNRLIVDIYSQSDPLIYGEFDNDILAFNAKVGIGTVQPVSPLQIKGGTDTSLVVDSGQLILGEETSSNLSMDNNEIQARNNGVASILYLQQSGGDVYVGNAVVHASDKRLKRDIEDLSFGLKEVLQLEPKEYFWKGKEQETKSLGLIAQEVEAVIKNVVTYDTEADKYGVSYTELIPVLIKAIKEQNETINKMEQDHKAFISSVKKEIEVLKAEINN